MRYFPPDQNAIQGCPFYFLTRLKKIVIILIVYCTYVAKATLRPQGPQPRQVITVEKTAWSLLPRSWKEKCLLSAGEPSCFKEEDTRDKEIPLKVKILFIWLYWHKFKTPDIKNLSIFWGGMVPQILRILNGSRNYRPGQELLSPRHMLVIYVDLHLRIRQGQRSCRFSPMFLWVL